MACCRQKIPVRGALVIVGGIIIHLTLGTVLTVGNTVPYYVSYIRKHSSPSNLSYADGIWIQGWITMGQGITMFTGSFLERRVGLRLACLTGCWLLSAGVVLTRWSLNYNYLTSVVTYGVMFGMGCGIALPFPVACAMRWFPGRRGLVTGLIMMGFGLGPTIFNPIITEYLNPNNLAPNLTIGEDVYFTQDKLLDRVPSLFLILGGTYAAMQLVGVILIVNPPDFETNRVSPEENPKRVDEQTAGNTQITEKYRKIEPAEQPSVSENGFSIVEAHGPQTDDTSTGNKSDPDTATEIHVHAELRLQALKEPPAPNNTDGFSSLQDAESIHVRDETPIGSDVVVTIEYGPRPPKGTGDVEISPLQMLRHKQFYALWFVFLFAGLGTGYMVSIYKSYGQSFIKDDQFIALVGSCGSFSTSMGSLSWGYVADRYGCDTAMKILYTLFAFVCFTFPGSELGMKPYFLIWVCLVYFTVAGEYTVMPALIARMFGNKYLSTNYGLLFTSQTVTAAASAFMGQMLQDIFHYHGLFYLMGGMSYIGFLITFFVHARTSDGKKI